jgi:hypothetical protein
MMITLDAMAERYHLLPSDILAKGTTFDLRVLDVGASWNRHQQQQHQASINPNKPSTKNHTRDSRALTQEVMNQMIETARKKHDQRKTNNTR